jgi:hypothetical protein
VVGETRINGGGNSIAVKGNVAFVTAADTGLHIVDIAEVTTPQRIGGFSTNQQLGPVLIEGDFAFVGAQTGFFTFDIRDARNPVQLRFVSAPPVRDWLVRDGQLYALSGPELRAYDVTEPGNPRQHHRVPLRKEMQGLTVEGAFAYMGGFEQLEIISLKRAANPQSITNFTGTGESQSDVKISGHYAYVTEEAKALHIIDLTAESPKLSGTFTNQNSVATAVMGDFAYIADLQRGITVVDLRDPGNPVPAGFYASGRSQDVVVRGTHLYVANFIDGLLILDISSPADPTFVSQLATARSAVGVVVRDEIAYVSGGSAGLHLVNIGNKANPQLLSTIPGGVVCAEVNGTIVYASLTPNTIAVLDCTYPASPKKIDTLTTRGWAVKMMIDENYLYCAELGGGVEVFDVKNASSPRRVGGNSRYTVTSIAASVDRVYLATRGDGLTESYLYKDAIIGGISRFSPITTLRVEGPPTLSGTLETSSDFIEWTGIESVTFGERVAELLYPGGNAAHQFYRMRVK